MKCNDKYREQHLRVIDLLFQKSSTTVDEYTYNHYMDVADHFDVYSDAYMVAILHDSIEDGILTYDDLKNINPDVLSALKVITRRKDEVYQDYIKRIPNNKLALVVKMKDLRENMIRCVKSYYSNRSKSLLKRYMKAYEYLQPYYEGLKI